VLVVEAPRCFEYGNARIDLSDRGSYDLHKCLNGRGNCDALGSPLSHVFSGKLTESEQLVMLIVTVQRVQRTFVTRLVTTQLCPDRAAQP